jgi:hypothetical protein
MPAGLNGGCCLKGEMRKFSVHKVSSDPASTDSEPMWHRLQCSPARVKPACRAPDWPRRPRVEVAQSLWGVGVQGRWNPVAGGDSEAAFWALAVRRSHRHNQHGSTRPLPSLDNWCSIGRERKGVLSPNLWKLGSTSSPRHSLLISVLLSELGTRVGDHGASRAGPRCSVHREIDAQRGTWLKLVRRDRSSVDPWSHRRVASWSVAQSSAQPSPSLTAPSSRASSLCVPVGRRDSGPLESGPQLARRAIRAQGAAPGVRRCSL